MASIDARRLRLYALEDVGDAFRERRAHVLAALFGLVGAWMAYGAGEDAGDAELASQLLSPLVMLAPIVVLGFVAPALVERRTTGGLTVVLGLPFSRLTVVLGTWLGRGVVMVGALLVAVLVGVPVALARGVAIDPVRLLAATGGLALLVVAFTAIAVAISAVARTSTRASFAAFATYVLFVFHLWAQLPLLVLYVVSGLEYPATIPAWVGFVAALNPVAAFSNLLAGAVGDVGAVLFVEVPAEPAIYERPLGAVAILLAWIVGPLALGYARFRSTDL